jgi:hypothetical protein
MLSAGGDWRGVWKGLVQAPVVDQGEAIAENGAVKGAARGGAQEAVVAVAWASCFWRIATRARAWPSGALAPCGQRLVGWFGRV